MNWLPLLLFIYSGFTINLVLQCALGIKGIVESKTRFNISTLARLALIFLSVIFLWFLFSRLLYPLFAGVFIYVLLFPVSVIFYDGAEYLVFRYVLKTDAKSDSIISFPCGVTAAGVFICVNIADNFLEVLIMSFGFVFGIFLVNLVIREIRMRASLEAVPVFIRGRPLVLITMGLLSLVFSTVSVLLFRMIGAG